MNRVMTGSLLVNGVPWDRATLTITNTPVLVPTPGPGPDPRWETTDSAGHYHARAEGTLPHVEPYPTLDRRVEHVNYDGACDDHDECDGFNRVEYTCRVCHEVVVPGMAARSHVERIPGPQEWGVEAELYVDRSPIRPRDLVSVRCVQGGLVRFGVAHVDAVTSVSPVGDLVVVRARLTGVGPLGGRAA